MNQVSNQWKDYEIIDTGNKEKLERWNQIILRRPDPVCIWPIEDESKWEKADAIYHRSKSGGGQWEFKKPLKEFWTIGYKDLRFKISPTGFKHTGLFPEQAANWDFMSKVIQESNLDQIRILNLFAYTGGATMACAKAGASEVVHVDASKGMVQWAKENMVLSHLEDHKIRFIVDDCLKFVKREQRRGRTYHGIIMDPPSYGRGPNGELWKLEDQLFELIMTCQQILDPDALFFIVNCYTTGFSCSTLQQTLAHSIQKERKGQVEVGENLLPVSHSNDVLPCGIFGRWTK
ncbi:class I SAM-dependent methyltransferase [Floccifex sp.]|uniref:class I SAM-dependent methyltransferase n=1 Tax=Floccifex sp. TaxID=2815810 RepID=UPI003EFE4547